MKFKTINFVMQISRVISPMSQFAKSKTLNFCDEQLMLKPLSNMNTKLLSSSCFSPVLKSCNSTFIHRELFLNSAFDRLTVSKRRRLNES